MKALIGACFVDMYVSWEDQHGREPLGLAHVGCDTLHDLHRGTEHSVEGHVFSRIECVCDDYVR